MTFEDVKRYIQTPEFILATIDRHSEIDKETIISFFNQVDINLCKADFLNIRRTLSEFKDDENIIGNFAKIYKYESINDIQEFLKAIEYDGNDDMIFWLASNNIKFINAMTSKQRYDYILSSIASFDKYYKDINDNEDEKHYLLKSSYNEISIHINNKTSQAVIDIIDNAKRDWHAEIKNPVFCIDIKSTLKNAIQEYQQE